MVCLAPPPKAPQSASEMGLVRVPQVHLQSTAKLLMMVFRDLEKDFLTAHVTVHD